MRTRLLLGASSLGLCVAFVLVALISIRTHRGEALDHVVRDVVTNGLPSGPRRLLSDVAREGAFVALVPVVGMLGLLALIRFAWRRVTAAALVSAAVPWFSHFAQRSLSQSSDGYPSNHASVALALLCAGAILWPAPLGRTGIVATAAVAGLLGLGNVTFYAHLPSHVLGSALLVAACTTAAIALVGGNSANLRHRPKGRGQDEGRETTLDS